MFRRSWQVLHHVARMIHCGIHECTSDAATCAFQGLSVKRFYLLLYLMVSRTYLLLSLDSCLPVLPCYLYLPNCVVSGVLSGTLKLDVCKLGKAPLRNRVTDILSISKHRKLVMISNAKTQIININNQSAAGTVVWKLSFFLWIQPNCNVGGIFPLECWFVCGTLCSPEVKDIYLIKLSVIFCKL